MRQAKLDGCDYVWVDTCCIDKSSSADLQEAINSMYEWYKRAKVCYAYLWDVVDCPISPTEGNVQADEHPHGNFTRSVWFTRGWTLQELIAPSDVKFYAQDWAFIGTRNDHVNDIATTTGIARDLLLGRREPTDYSIAQRMSWAANRTLRRKEDEAYCLLGLFDVSIPMLYGEGRKAFRKLQQELLNNTTDQSILAWSRPPGSPVAPGQLLAESPTDFADCGSMIRGSTFQAHGPFRADNRGVTGTFPVAWDHDSRRHVILNCSQNGCSVALRMGALEPHHEIAKRYGLDGHISKSSNADNDAENGCSVAVKYDWKTEYRILPRHLAQQKVETSNLVLLKSMHEYPFYWGPVNMRVVRADSEETDRLRLDSIMPPNPRCKTKSLSSWSCRMPIDASLPQQHGGVLAVTLAVAQSSKAQCSSLQIAFVVNRIAVPDNDGEPMRFDGAILITEGSDQVIGLQNSRKTGDSYSRVGSAVEEAYSHQKEAQVPGLDSDHYYSKTRTRTASVDYVEEAHKPDAVRPHLLASDRWKTGTGVTELKVSRVYGLRRSAGLGVTMKVVKDYNDEFYHSRGSNTENRGDIRPVVELQLRFLPHEPEQFKKSLLGRLR